MRSRGLRNRARVTADTWTSTDTVTSTGDEEPLPWSTTGELKLRPTSIYRVVCWGWWSVDAPSGGCEGQITVYNGSTLLTRVRVAVEQNNADALYPWQAHAWVRTGPDPADLEPSITAELVGSSSGGASFTVGAGLLPAVLVVHRVARPGLSSLDGLAVPL